MLSPADLVAVHEAALRVLERTGVLVHDDDAVALLRAHGARADGRRVFIGEGAVQAALAAAPSPFILRGRSAARDLQFGTGRPVFASASGPAFVAEGDRLRPGTLADAEAAVKLGHVSTAIALHGDCIAPLDLEEGQRTRRGTHARLVLSDKAVEWVAGTDDDIHLAVAANEILFGAEWQREPRALTVLNTTSPLQLSGETAKILTHWARLRQPACVTACVMGGTTGPATAAGVLVVQHAEVLAALVLVQAAAEGCPFVYGGLSAMASMRTGAAHFGTADFGWLTEATVQLAKLCGLPVRAGAAVTDAHALDAQAALESALGLLPAVRAGADFVLQAAGILSSFNALSFEKFVVDDAMLDMLCAQAEPAAADADGLAEDVIDTVGPGGGYLGEAHTRRHARDLDRPTFLVREAFERWRAQGDPDLRAAATREVARRLESFEPPDDLDPLVRRQLSMLCLV